MPPRRPTLNTRILGLACLAAVLAPAAASAAPVATTTPPAAPVQLAPDVHLTKIQIPTDAQFYADLNLLPRAPFLGAAGNLLWLYDRQRSPDDARALGAMTASLAPATSTPLVGALLRGSTALRNSSPFANDAGPGVGLATSGRSLIDSAVGGGNWFADRPKTPRPARSTFVQFDDSFAVTGHISMPKGLTAVAAIPTRKGVRLLATEPLAVNHHVRAASATPVVLDGAHVTKQRYLASLSGAAPLPDGSLLVAGASRSALPDPVLRITPHGAVMRLADRRKPSATLTTGRIGMFATSAGVVMDETTSPDTFASDNPANTVKDAVVLRGANGAVLRRRLVSDLQFPRPQGCVQTQLLTLGLGPDGLPVARVDCLKAQDPGQYQRRDLSVTMVGLDSDLNARWWRPAPEIAVGPDSPYFYARAGACGSDTIGSDGRLDIVDCDGNVTAVTVPGASVARGTLGRSKATGKHQAVARIVCNGPYGSVCSGVAQVTANGQTLGSATYALPGRPGGAAASIDRHISTTVTLPKRFSVTLGSA